MLETQYMPVLPPVPPVGGLKALQAPQDTLDVTAIRWGILLAAVIWLPIVAFVLIAWLR